MKAKGKVFKYGDNVDTDVIIPARYLAIQDQKEGINQKNLRRCLRGDITPCIIRF